MEIATLFFAILYLILFLYMLLGWHRLFRPSKVQNKEKTAPLFISIVCPFRNEINTLSKFIDSIEKQNYPRDKFELILINDHSEDGGLAHVKSLLPSLKINTQLHSLNENQFSKKAALTYGIDRSNGQIIITTDCDTTRTNDWVNSFAKSFNDTISDMIIGPVKMKAHKSLFSRFQALEFLSLQIVTATFTANKNPILCNGANLAFKKAAYIKVDGYKSQKTVSGDDFFLMMNFKKAGMTISFNSFFESMVVVDPMKSINAFINQRLRWAGKSLLAQDLSFYLTGIFNTAFALFLLIIPIYILVSKLIPLYFFLFIGFKFGGDWTLLKKAADKYDLSFSFKDVLSTFLCYPFYISAIFMLSFSSKPTWKGRQI